MRLVSTVELIAIRERVHNALDPYEGPVPPEHFDELLKAVRDFKEWYELWDVEFSRKYENAGMSRLLSATMCLIRSLAFYRQSLRIQHLHAELFHNATALRGINGPEDVKKMPGSQRELALRSIEIAREGLDITVNSTSYREGMKYGMGIGSTIFRIDLIFIQPSTILMPLRRSRDPSCCASLDSCKQISFLCNPF